MEPTIEQTTLEKLRALAPEQQQQVLKFIESLEPQTVPRHLTIWDQVKDIIEAVPSEAWDEVPTDGAANVDHYLYGAPKVP